MHPQSSRPTTWSVMAAWRAMWPPRSRILLNQGKGDTAVIGVDDPWGQRICTEITAANRRTIRADQRRRRPWAEAVYVLVRACSTTRPANGRPRRPTCCAPARCPGVTTGRTRPRPTPPCAAWASPAGRSGRGADEHSRAWPTGWRPSVRSAGCGSSTTARPPTPTPPARPCRSYPQASTGSPADSAQGRRGIEALTDLFPRIEKAYLIGDAADEPSAIRCKARRQVEPVRYDPGGGRRGLCRRRGQRRGRGRPAVASLRLVRSVRRLRSPGRSLPFGRH